MYELNERQRRFRDELRDFYSKNVESDWRHQTESWDDLGAYLRRWDSVLYEGGWSVPTWPEEYGGRGADAVERAIFAEETARFDAPEGLGRLGKRLVAPILMEYGSPEQKAMLEPVRRGEVVWCQGFSEPDAGSDLANIRVRAVSDGSDWVVNGTKVWTSFAQFAQ